jgi:diguanylate cyclase (GGDEF)-like protein/PAS domain S-box-containing protein
VLHVVAAVPGHDWLLWSAQPLMPLLAPVGQARRAVLPELTLVVLSLTLVLALVLRWQLQPLRRLERHAKALLAGEARGDWPQADGEIGRLARTLHHLWAERTQMESFNAQVLQKLGSVMSAAPVGLAFTRNQHFELVSEELCRLLGRPEQDIVGQRTQVIFASNEDYAALGPQVTAAFAQGQPYSGEWPLLRADGTRFWGLLRARPVAPEAQEAGTIWSLNDVSEQVAARRQLEHAAHHDALTGVVNRQGFEGALQSLFDAQPGSRPASLVMIDLDHFKPINDTAGHAAGDAMLVAVAQAIASRVRATDIVVRLGGDEFALLLPHCPHERALGVAEKVREAITDLALTWEAHTLRVGASLGVAELGEHHESAAQWMAQADAACYEAKRHGRGRVRAARPELKVMQGGR